jgi:UDP-N-acetylmuramoyl-tripeptide--D-alanyl-D-alanine ligase
VVGVTGSVGKTSAKETLMACFEAAGLTVHGTIGNLNNHWGVPLTLARMPRATEAAVIEMGMNHAGEIAPLSKLARPAVSLITAIAPAHLENFGTITGIAQAKAEIFVGQEPGTVTILPAETAEAAVLVAAAAQAGLTVRRFGVTTDCDYRLSSYTPGVDRSDVAIELAGQWMRVRLGVTGEHMAINATGVIGVCLALGLDAGQVAPGLMRMRLMKGRGARRRVHLPTGPVLLIDESYNASPTAMAAALRSLGAIDPAAGGRRIAVLGDMLELGKEGPAFHAGLLKPVTGFGIDLVFTCGPQMQRLFDALPKKMRGGTRSTSAALAPVVIQQLRPNDIVMVKGSLGSGMAQVIKAIESAGSPDPILPEALQDVL